MSFNPHAFRYANVKNKETYRGPISRLSGQIGNPSLTVNKQTSPDVLKSILLHSKVIPQIQNYSNQTKLYLYVYMDPSKPIDSVTDYKYTIPNQYKSIFGTSTLMFGYQPIYIGRGVSSTGFRFNQHITEFLKETNSENGNTNPMNKFKMDKFREMEQKFHENGLRDWQDYKNNFVKIMFEFDSREDLDKAEVVLIQLIGSLNGRNRGPLTNIMSTK